MKFLNFLKESEESQIHEVKMSPSVFAKFGNSEKANEILVGAEFEMYFRGAITDTKELPPWDASLTWDDIEEYAFEDNPDAVTKMEEGYDEWYQTLLEEYEGDYLQPRIVEAAIEEHEDKLLRFYNEKQQVTDKETLEAIIKEKGDYPVYQSSREFETKASENQKIYSKLSFDLQDDMEGMSNSELDDFLFDALGNPPQWAGGWMEYYTDEVQDVLRRDFENSVDVSIPRFFEYMQAIDGWQSLSSYYGGSLSDEEGFDLGAAESLAYSLSKEIGYEVEAYSEYKSSEAGDWVDRGVWVMEPDGSVTGQGDDQSDLGIEIKSPPIPLPEFVQIFDKFVKWAKENKAYTNKQTGLHLNMSIPDGGKIDYLKLVLFAGADKVSADFERTFNSYAKSNLKTLEKVVKDDNRYEDKISDSMAALKQGLLTKASKILDDSNYDRYMQINFKYSYVEFRAPGNDWLGQYLPQVTETLYRFGYALTIAADASAEREEYAKKLYKLLSNAGREDLLAPFVKFASGLMSKKELKHTLAYRSRLRKMRFDPAKMTVEDFKQIFKENGLDEFKVKSRDGKNFYTVKGENLIQIGRLGTSDKVTYRYHMRFERENEDPMFVDTIQLVYFSPNLTTEILGLTDKF